MSITSKQKKQVWDICLANKDTALGIQKDQFRQKLRLVKRNIETTYLCEHIYVYESNTIPQVKSILQSFGFGQKHLDCYE